MDELKTPEDKLRELSDDLMLSIGVTMSAAEAFEIYKKAREEAFKKETEEAKRRADTFRKEVKKLIDSLKFPAEEAWEQFLKLRELFRGGAISRGFYIRGIASELEKLEGKTKPSRQVRNYIGSAKFGSQEAARAITPTLRPQPASKTDRLSMERNKKLDAVKMVLNQILAELLKPDEIITM